MVAVLLSCPKEKQYFLAMHILVSMTVRPYPHDVGIVGACIL